MDTPTEILEDSIVELEREIKLLDDDIEHLKSLLHIVTINDKILVRKVHNLD